MSNELKMESSLGEKLGAIAVLWFVLYWLLVLPGVYIYNFFQLRDPKEGPQVIKKCFSRVRTWLWVFTAIPMYIFLIHFFISRH